MPKSNDSFFFVTEAPTAFNSQVSLDGANQTWLFPKAASPVQNLVEYKASNRTPYAFYFFNTVGLKVADSIGFGQIKMTDIYQFFSNSTSKYSVEGLGFRISLAPFPLAGMYQQEDVIYHFPLEYGNRDSSNFRVQVSIPSIGSYSQTGYRITEVVGYGSVIVGSDTMNCLKVKSEIFSQDTINSSFASFGFPNNRIEYKWLTTEYRIPVAEVSGTFTAGVFVPNLARYLIIPENNQNPPNPGTGILDASTLSPTLYPNPSKSWVRFPDEMSVLDCVDMKGRRMEFSIQGNALIHQWPEGVYVVRFMDQTGKLWSQKLQVIP